MNKDFKKDKTKNNLLQLVLTGQASGIGQLVSGILCIVIGIIVLVMQ